MERNSLSMAVIYAGHTDKERFTNQVHSPFFTISLPSSYCFLYFFLLQLQFRLHYRENLNLTDLADKYHFNHSYLTRIFKKQKGQYSLKLINSLRIEDAKELLLNPEPSVREISEMLGFSDQHYFSRSFKNSTGLSPNEYRNIK